MCCRKCEAVFYLFLIRLQDGSRSTFSSQLDWRIVSVFSAVDSGPAMQNSYSVLMYCWCLFAEFQRSCSDLIVGLVWSSRKLDSATTFWTFQSLMLGVFQNRERKADVEKVGINNQDISVLFHINGCEDMTHCYCAYPLCNSRASVVILEHCCLVRVTR